MPSHRDYTAIPIDDDEPPVMSNKAKGKQRASSDSSQSPQLYLNIRFTQLAEDLLAIEIAPDQTIRNLKLEIALQRPLLASKRLKLIYLGRVLTDGLILHPWLETLLQRQSRQNESTANTLLDAAEAVVKSTLESTSEPAHPRDEPGRSPATALWLHCSVGEPLEPVSPTDIKVRLSRCTMKLSDSTCRMRKRQECH
jgi:hypothetical protein